MTWELLFIPALLCFLAGILAAMSWLEQKLVDPRRVVLVPVAKRVASRRPVGTSEVGSGEIHG